jgi:ABC-type phosphate/phosphonate transport system substrate-binding protein
LGICYWRLAKNEVDLAAMGSSEYTKLDSVAKLQLKPIWLSTEIPLGPVLFHKKIKRSIQKQLIELLLKAHEQAPSVLASIKAAWSEAKQATHFETISKSHYNPFLAQFGNRKTIQPILQQFAN